MTDFSSGLAARDLEQAVGVKVRGEAEHTAPSDEDYCHLGLDCDCPLTRLRCRHLEPALPETIYVRLEETPNGPRYAASALSNFPNAAAYRRQS